MVQGLTLPALIRALGVTDDGSEEEAEEHAARIAAAEAALDVLDALAADSARDQTVERLRGLYSFRPRRFATLSGGLEDEEGIIDRSLDYQRLMRALIDEQRSAIVQLRNERVISSEVTRRVERDLDLEESRLEI